MRAPAVRRKQGARASNAGHGSRALRASAFIATSLDGFIARKNGGLDWLPGPEDAEDYGYGAFIRRIDALVMGRKTFEKVLSFGEWPYGKKPVIVLTGRRIEIPKRLGNSVEALSGTPARIVDLLAKRGLCRLYIDGGQTITAFLEAGLIDEIVITRVPVILGEGIPLFGPVSRSVTLRHVGTRRFKSGLVQSRYEVARRAPARRAARK